MGCGEIQDGFELYALGELDAAESGRLAAHLAACPSCKQSAADAGEMLGQLDAALRAPADLPRRILAALEARAQRPRRRFGWFAWPEAAALAACLVLAVTAWMFRLPGRGNHTAGTGGVQLIACQVAPSAGAKYEVVGGRTIRLDGGEIFVQVQKASESLVVRTPAGDATAIGTKFYVDCEPLDKSAGFETTVTVVEGVVQLKNSLGTDQAGAGEELLAATDAAPKKQATSEQPPQAPNVTATSGATATPNVAATANQTPAPAASAAATASPSPRPAAATPAPGGREPPADGPFGEERRGGPVPPPTSPGTIPPPPQTAPGGAVENPVLRTIGQPAQE